jgi:adenylate cyclase
VRRLLAAFAAVALAAAALEIFVARALEPLEHGLLDAFTRWHAVRLAPDPDVVLVDIDEKSLAAMQSEAGRFPWPREVYAELLRGLMPQQPRAVVFDILFSEPDKFRPQSDQAFAEAALPFRERLYFPMLMLDARDHASGAAASELAPLVGLVRRPDADIHARIALVPPLALPQELWRGGTINFLEDDDHVGRRYALRTTVRGWDVPSLAARVALDQGFPVPDAPDLRLAWRGKVRGLPRSGSVRRAPSLSPQAGRSPGASSSCRCSRRSPPPGSSSSPPQPPRTSRSAARAKRRSRCSRASSIHTWSGSSSSAAGWRARGRRAR